MSSSHPSACRRSSAPCSPNNLKRIQHGMRKQVLLTTTNPSGLFLILICSVFVPALITSLRATLSRFRLLSLLPMNLTLCLILPVAMLKRMVSLSLNFFLFRYCFKFQLCLLMNLSGVLGISGFERSGMVWG